MKNLILKILEAFRKLFGKKPETPPITGENPSVNSGFTGITGENPAVSEEPEYTEIENEDNYENLMEMEDLAILELELKRIYTCSKYTIGHLYINGEYVCDTLEDTDRGLDDSMSESEIKEKKVYGKTAIPTGLYEILMNIKSPKFSDFTRYKWAEKYDGKLPHLSDVKCFVSIKIHVGNSADDSDGCILVGYNKSKGCVCDSTATFKMLMDKYLVPAAQQNRKIVINIFREYVIN